MWRARPLISTIIHGGGEADGCLAASQLWSSEREQNGILRQMKDGEGIPAFPNTMVVDP